MEYYTYKLHFHTGIHIGNGLLSAGENTIPADTFFSTLCHEAFSFGGDKGIDELVGCVRQKRLIFSDLMPFIGNELYIPKPMCIVKCEDEGNSVIKKNFKKLKYIPLSKIDSYVCGELDPIEENNRLNSLGKFEVRTMSSSKNPDKANSGEMLPFGVGIYRFADNNGLYCIVGFDGEAERLLFEKLLHALSYSGIGGKRSSGLGSFSFASDKLGEPIVTRLNGRNHVISLSVSMAAPEELDLALTGARYTLIKRSGFVYSDSYADSPRRKKDFYSFKAGSYFLNGFDGGIFDVSGGGTHPVYRYAIPLFMEV